MDGADRRLQEVPYVHTTKSGRHDVGHIDALYRRCGTWTVVEYKTDELRGETRLRQVLHGNGDGEHGYLHQVRRYAEAAEALLGTRPRVILCMLDYARGVRLLDEGGFDASIARPDAKRR